MVKIPVFKGSCTAIVTPYRNGEIDYDKFSELIEHQYVNNTAAILVCGTTGENPSHTEAEHNKLVEHCISAVDSRMKVVVGIGANNPYHALEYAKHAEANGADGLLMTTPYYNKTSQKGLVQHFSYVADRVSCPLILYNVPARTGIGISPETYLELSKHPNICGTKEASGNLAQFALTRSLCGDDLLFWSGNDSDTVTMMAMGALGVISVASNVIPKEVAELCRLCFEGDFKVASDYYFKYADFFEAIFVETNPMPIKEAMNLHGMDVGDPRLPLINVSEKSRERLIASMKNIGLAVK